MLEVALTKLGIDIIVNRAKRNVIIGSNDSILPEKKSLPATTDSAFAGKKYEKNQAISQANTCGNGELPSNVGCQNTT